MVAPEGEAPVAVADGDVVELVGGADRRLLGDLQDGVAGLLGGEGPQPQRRARRWDATRGGGAREGEGRSDGADGGGSGVEGRPEVVLDRRHGSNGIFAELGVIDVRESVVGDA